MKASPRQAREIGGLHYGHLEERLIDPQFAVHDRTVFRALFFLEDDSLSRVTVQNL